MEHVSLEARVGGQTVTFWFYPERLMQLQPLLAEAVRDDKLEAIIAILVEVMDAWDVIQYEGGPMVPITYKTLAMLPFVFCVELLQAMGYATMKLMGGQQ